MPELRFTAEVRPELLELDEEKREIYGLIVPFEQDAQTARGLERFAPGVFADVDPSRVVLRMRHQDPPTGRAIELQEKSDGIYGRFKISKTAAGDEQMTLARDGVETGLSVGFEDGEFKKESVGNRTRWHHLKAALREVSTTWMPAYSSAGILQTRDEDQREEDMAEETQTVEAPAVSTAVETVALQERMATVLEKIDKIEQRQTQNSLEIPGAADSTHTMKAQVKLELRALADVITTGNEGVVPDAVVNEMLGRVQSGRPFLNNTRRIEAPPAGVSLVMPRLTQTPLVATQADEKDELASRATTIGSVSYDMITKGGAADLSMQLIRRSSPQFLSLWLELLGEAYAQNTEDGAIDALLAAAGVVAGGTLDPAAPTFGGAFENAASATGRTMAPDRIFLSTAAISAFIDALEPSGGGGRPLYPGIAGVAGLDGGGTLPGGFTLQPVWTPELDDEAVDAIVGPSRAFVWAEDGTYTLQADVPAKFGRDVGLAGMIWYAPIYPAAFTTYTLPV